MNYTVIQKVAQLIAWAYKVRNDPKIQVEGSDRSDFRGMLSDLAPGLHALLQKHMEGGYLELEPSPWTPFEPALLTEEQKQVYRDLGIPGDDVIFLNSRYQVNVRHLTEGMDHLSIKRLDKQPHLDWRDLQRIKNELCSPDREAVEVFPRESRLVDSSNQRHVWVFPAGFTLPFGLGQTRFVMPDIDEGDALQRPFEQETA